MEEKTMFVETYRDIVSPVLMSTDGEGDDTSGNTWFIGLIFSILFIAGIDWLLAVISAPIPLIIIISVLLLIISLLIFPFKLSKRLKNYRDLRNAVGSSFSDINLIVGFKDNLVLWPRTAGYILELTPNYYNNYNNYAADFKGFLELFKDFTLHIDYIKNTEPVDYIDIDKVNIYSNLAVSFDRINLARYANEELRKKSKVFIIYLTIMTNNSNIDALDRQIEEMRYSNYKRAFSEIKFLGKQEVLKLMSIETGLYITEDSLITSKDKSIIDNKADDRFKIYRKG